MFRSILGSFLLLTAAATTATAAEKRVQAEIVPSVATAAPGESFDIAIKFTIERDWHMYWLNPGDSGMPPSVKWKLPEGVTVGPLRFPSPHRIKLPDGLVSFGYENELVLLATVTTAKELKSPLELAGDLKWLVCRDVCLPEKQSVSVSIPVGQHKTQRDEDFARWRANLPTPAKNGDKWTVAGRENSTAGELRVPLASDMKDPDLFPPPSDSIDYAPPKIVTENEGRFIVVPFRVLPGSKNGFAGDAVLTYTNSEGKRAGVSQRVEFKIAE